MLSAIYLPWHVPWYILWYIWGILCRHAATMVRAQGQPPRKNHFFAKNLKNRRNSGRNIGHNAFFMFF